MVEVTEELFRLVPPFAALPPEEKHRLAAIVHHETVPPDTILLREGEVGERLFLLLEGEVEIVKALGLDAERLLAVRGPGTLIGEMSLFSRDGRHTASVRSCTPLRVLFMGLREMEDLLGRQPSLAYDMMRTLSQRLEAAENRTIQELLEKNRQLARAYEELKAAQAQLVEKERLEAELRVARSIQRSILPRATPRLPGYGFGMLIEPVSSVGGDLCDFYPLKGGRLGIAIGDVSGHGVGSALFMALAFSVLRAEASRGAAPARVLRNVNRMLLQISDSGMFVTMLYGLLDSDSGEFSYARAAHPPPLLMDARGELLPPAVEIGQPLGMFEDLLLDEQSLSIPAGGRLLLYTDGATEAIDDQARLFGPERLTDAFCQAQGVSAQGLCQAVYDAVLSFCGSTAPEDDILFVAIQAR
jgi:serine phosphatase RsbU (regulator of sigma subunit)